VSVVPRQGAVPDARRADTRAQAAIADRLAGPRLRVNPIACDAHGMCAELLPERITLDEWGYPVLADEALTPELLAHARAAAKACPTRALLLEERRRR
jgi:ferredoxin